MFFYYFNPKKKKTDLFNWLNEKMILFSFDIKSFLTYLKSSGMGKKKKV